jgi:hypothetical protein
LGNFRIPGPVGVGEDWPNLADGTLALWLTTSPGPLNADSWRSTPWAINALERLPAAQLDFLFQMCLNPCIGLSEEDYGQAAAELGVEVSAIKAIAEVETSGRAFDDSGRPRILFERHYFHRLTHGKHSRKHPDISNPKSGGYGKFAHQYAKLQRAYALDRTAALKSASWGRFQIMGSNYTAAGFATVEGFVLAMTESESQHLQAFVSFVKANKAMLKALQGRNWARFAAAYNGANYKANAYDEKLKSAYAKHTMAIPAVESMTP